MRAKGVDIRKIGTFNDNGAEEQEINNCTDKFGGCLFSFSQCDHTQVRQVYNIINTVKFSRNDK
jgi:hypothetical protein